MSSGGDCISASCSRLGRHDVHGGEIDAHLEIGGSTSTQTVDEIEITLVIRIRHSARTRAIRRTMYSGKRNSTRGSRWKQGGQTIDVTPGAVNHPRHARRIGGVDLDGTGHRRDRGSVREGPAWLQAAHHHERGNGQPSHTASVRSAICVPQGAERLCRDDG